MKPGRKRKYDTRRTVKLTLEQAKALAWKAHPGGDISATIRECLFEACEHCGTVRIPVDKAP